MRPHWPALLDRSAATPLWRQLLADLRLVWRAVTSTTASPELQLMAQYEVSA